MSVNPIEVLQIQAPDTCAERIEAAIEALHAAGSSCWSPVDAPIHHYDVFFDTADDADRALNALNLQRLASDEADAWVLTRASLPHTDWANAWKRHFRIEHVTERIVIRPCWEPYVATDGQIVIDIDPGMSFGTGRHETTKSCLQFLDSLLLDGASGAFLDIGTGSGILAMAAARGGLHPVVAYDIDPDAVQNARENIERNDLADQIVLSTGDLSGQPARQLFQIVAANILAPVLIEHAATIAAQADPLHGHIILAGILQTQARDVVAAYRQQNWHLVRTLEDGEWTGLLLRPAMNA